MTTGNSGDPLTPGEAENIICIFAPLMLAEFSVSLRARGGGGVVVETPWRLRNKHAKPPSPSVSSLFPHLGRISEESAEFFERVNGVLQKQQNMLQAAQAEVTSNHAATFPSVTSFKLRPRRHRLLRGGGGGVKMEFLTFFGGGLFLSPCSVREGPPPCLRPPSTWTSLT